MNEMSRKFSFFMDKEEKNDVENKRTYLYNENVQQWKKGM